MRLRPFILPFLEPALNNRIYQISMPQFMQAHTVLKTIVDQFADKPILVLGGRPGAVPEVAKEWVMPLPPFL